MLNSQLGCESNWAERLNLGSPGRFTGLVESQTGQPGYCPLAGRGALLHWLKAGREGAILRRRRSDHEGQFGEGVGETGGCRWGGWRCR